MRSQDSIPYYEHHAARLAQLATGSNSDAWVPFLKNLDPKSRVLDLGCGAGFDLIALKTAGHQAVGIEGAPTRAQEARDRSGCEVWARNFLFWTPKEGEWDGIWANQSFQHLTAEEAQRVVASAFKGLRVGGILGVVVPEGVGAYEDREGDLEGPSRWIHPYTEKQLCSMIEQTGFTILQVGRRQNERTSELLVLCKRI